MKKFAWAVSALIVLTGCGPSSPDQSVRPSVPTGMSDSPASPARTTGATATPSLPPGPGPDCDSDAVRHRDDFAAPLTCTVRSASFPTLRFEYTDAGTSIDGRRGQRIVVRDGDHVVQTITGQLTAGYAQPPLVQRFAGDGAGQFLVVTSAGGSGGIGMAVWRAQSPTGPFVRGGDLFGFPERVATTDEGFSAIYAHSSAARGVYTVFRFDGDRVVELLNVPVAAAVANAEPGDGTGPVIRNGQTNCRAVQPSPRQASALREAGVTVVGVGERLCRQRWVGGTYGG